MTGDVFAHIRAACAAVTERARQVRIDQGRLTTFAAELAAAPPPSPDPDPAHHHLGSEDATLAFVLTLDAVNFGSGWFPHLRKRLDLSGYFTVATALEERFAREGPFDAAALEALDAGACARLFGQEGVAEVAELMEHFARALRDLGAFLRARHGSRFAGPVEAAGGRAAALVKELAQMPAYRDVSRYGRLEVPFYKRAQLTAADLAAAFGGRGPGRFADLDRLTLFADNLVPHVLRWEGVLIYEPDLAGRIDAGALLAAGSPEEVEIRAVAVHAVERCVAEMRAAGVSVTAQQLDYALWNRGQRPEIKAIPRHRARCVYY